MEQDNYILCNIYNNSINYPQLALQKVQKVWDTKRKKNKYNKYKTIKNTVCSNPTANHMLYVRHSLYI